MRLLSGILLLSVIACDRGTAHVSPCGMEVLDNGSAPDAYDVAAIERSSVAYRLVTCGKLNGWTLVVHPEPAWVDHAWGVRVAGVTHCRSAIIETGTPSDGEPYSRSALAHELAHVAECPWENLEHEGWDEKDAQGMTTHQRIAAVRR